MNQTVRPLPNGDFSVQPETPTPVRSFVRAIRFCSGGERVSSGNTATLCSYCTNGRCIAAGQACELPEGS